MKGACPTPPLPALKAKLPEAALDSLSDCGKLGHSNAATEIVDLECPDGGLSQITAVIRDNISIYEYNRASKVGKKCYFCPRECEFSNFWTDGVHGT